MAEVDTTIFGMGGQWQTGEEIAELERSGANRVTIWINARKTEESLAEMQSLAGELL